jgi:hypothetical protein
MKKVSFVFIGLVSLVWLISFGCRTQSAAVSIIQKDSLRIDTLIQSDTLYYIDQDVINSIYECDSNNQVILKENSFLQTKFDSLLKVSPLVRTVTKTKCYTSTKKEYQPAVVKVVYEKKYVNTLTVFSLIINGILAICLIGIIFLFYRSVNAVTSKVFNKKS